MKREAKMPHYSYLIVGGGMTAGEAVRGIREVDTNGSIGLIGQESDMPYSRPPLSKGLWKGQFLADIWRKTDTHNVSLHLGHTAQTLDPKAKRVVDEQGVVYSFDKCLLATGGTPRRLPFGGDLVIYFRTLRDYRRLRDLADQGRHIAVIGGGFIGSEIAAALAMNGRQVTMIYPEPGIGWRTFPPDLARHVSDYYREKGVDTIAGDSVVDIHGRGEQAVLKTRGGREISADAIVAGIGIQPNAELALEAGCAVENGVVVDEFLRTGHPDIYAAGDVAAFYNPALGKRIRVEHEDNALMMGRLAGRSMAGDAAPYHHLPFFYSDLFELGYEAVGELDSRLEVVADWKEPFREGVIYYLQNGRIRGVLLWNVWEQVDAARRLIAEPGPFHPEDLKGRLPESR
jgi:NADPH-dependent 2,4-dienoyl-CoA reductase/sulfur reductase-like enzyme